MSKLVSVRNVLALSAGYGATIALCKVAHYFGATIGTLGFWATLVVVAIVTRERIRR